MAVSAEVSIAASTQAVWEVLADFGAIERWSPVVRESHLTSDQREGVGCARHCELFPRGSIDEDVIAWEPGRHLGINGEPAGGPIESQRSDFRIELAEGGSSVIMTITFELTRAAAERLDSITDGLQRAVAGTTAGLKHHVETGEDVGTEVPALAKPTE